MKFVGFYDDGVHVLLPICVVHEQNCYKTLSGAPRFRAVAPNLFGTRNRRKIFRGPGDGEGNGLASVVLLISVSHCEGKILNGVASILGNLASDSRKQLSPGA